MTAALDSSTGLVGSATTRAFACVSQKVDGVEY